MELEHTRIGWFDLYVDRFDPTGEEIAITIIVGDEYMTDYVYRQVMRDSIDYDQIEVAIKAHELQWFLDYFQHRINNKEQGIREAQGYL